MGLFKNFMRNAGYPQAESISIPVASLMEDVATFVTKLETEETTKWCKCLWRIHPDDQDLTMGHCRACGQTKKRHTDQLETHRFMSLRRVRVDDHPFCPIHSKEGLIVGFIEWAEKHER